MTKDPTTELGAPAAASPHEARWFGHPRGLSTLFFTELWERFSYYGMRAILVLFMVAAVTDGGLGFTDGTATAVYGMYTALVYLLALPGGWVADNLWGQRRSVFVGGCIIAAGHFAMAAPVLGLPEMPFFFGGLVLITIGTGLLKPNVSTIVGELYPEGGARRDAGFSVFYMGINLGAFLGPIFCGFLAENVSWHLGFSLAGFGMLIGLIQYKYGEKFLGSSGLLASGDAPEVTERKARNFYMVLAGVVAAVAVFAFLAYSGVVPANLQEIATWLGFGILLLVVLFFTYLTLGTSWAGAIFGFFVVAVLVLPRFSGIETALDGGRWAVIGAVLLFIFLSLLKLATRGAEVTVEKRRLLVIFWLFLLAALFWSGFEQAGSSMNLFAERDTNRVLFGWEMPTYWLQSINPLFIITLAPIFGILWTWLAARRANPSIPVKFALGLLGLSSGFFVLAWGAANIGPNGVSPAWLVVTYFLHTCGELCLSPVGLSSMTKLAPAGRVGQMMGIWFIASALGNLIAGLVAGQIENLPSQQLFFIVATIVGGAGIFALLLSPLVKRLMGDVE
ncbi:MAG TPA: peptide MFS transporter [Thermoanaerobaculia bacterium]|nr:peptide MFS transporter [Thermoanaerobaculia bacterium]